MLFLWLDRRGYSWARGLGCSLGVSLNFSLGVASGDESVPGRLLVYQQVRTLTKGDAATRAGKRLFP